MLREHHASSMHMRLHLIFRECPDLINEHERCTKPNDSIKSYKAVVARARGVGSLAASYPKTIMKHDWIRELEHPVTGPLNSGDTHLRT
jgi:hypothetical protein